VALSRLETTRAQGKATLNVKEQALEQSKRELFQHWKILEAETEQVEKKNCWIREYSQKEFSYLNELNGVEHSVNPLQYEKKRLQNTAEVTTANEKILREEIAQSRLKEGDSTL